ALAEPRVEAIEDLDARRLHAARGLLDAAPYEAPERRDLARQDDGDPEVLPRRQIARGEVGLVAQALGHPEDLVAREGVDAGTVVERAVDGADGDPERIRDLADARRARASWPSRLLLALHLRRGPACFDGPRVIQRLVKLMMSRKNILDILQGD